MDETAVDRVYRLRCETGLSRNAIVRRISRGETDDQVREWGRISAQINAEATAKFRPKVFADLEEYRNDVIRTWWAEVCRRAEQKMLATGKLEGAHYAAATEMLEETK